jgi:predicted DNA binding CopG/RHH family protein
MDISPYVENLRTSLAATAAAGGPDTARAAELLAGALDAATRLSMLDALGTAAAEITAALPDSSVELRLRGREPEFVVTRIATETEAPPEQAAPVESGEDTARVTLRLPETLKSKVEQAAAREGLSVNAWLVRAVARATESGGRPSTPPPGGGWSKGPKRFTGYAKS